MEATESGDLRILPEVLAGEVPEDLREQVSWSAIAGPSIAGEVAVRRDTCVVFTGRDAGVLEEMAGLFRTPYYHVWTSTDFVGVEVCAAAKNCYALGAGFMEGILDREGESEAQYRNYDYGAALFGQATRELGRFMELLGGERETPYGLAGVGDMFVTSMGGRNVKVGRLVGSGLRFSEARGRMPGVTLEGAAAIEVIGGALPKLTERGIIGARGLPADAPPALRGRIGRAFGHALEHLFRGRTRKQSGERIEMSSRIPQDIERQVFDLIVVGAGINGAGIARDAAMRGLRVLLLDKGDISSGTTQWATRLIHGGLALPGALRVRAGKRVFEG